MDRRSNRPVLWLSAFVLFSCLTVESVSSELPELIVTIPSDTINTSFGHWITPLGDQNGDGYADFLLGSSDGFVYYYEGGDPPDTIYDLRFSSLQVDFVSNLGDINGDSVDDFGANGRAPNGWQYLVFYGGAQLDTFPDLRFGNSVNRPNGHAVVTDDINFNGERELIIHANALTQMTLLIFELGSDSDSLADFEIRPQYPTLYSGFGESIISGYFNSDDTIDIAVNFRPRDPDNTNGEVQFFFGGENFDTLSDFTIKRPGAFQSDFNLFGIYMRNLGDVNGDGFDDIYTNQGNSADSIDFIFFTGPLLDTIPDVILPMWSVKGEAAGDINDDKYFDLITSDPVSAFNVNKLWIYFGGPSMDSIPDVIIGRADLPNVVFMFGNGVSGVGDVNGDGVNDFAVSAKASTNQGLVYIFSGTGMGTDVEIINEPTLPTSFQLHQNYPNPFNPETVIEYSLPTRSIVNIEIHNVLGQRITTLVDEEQSAGNYRLRWDGRDQTGERLASGVYFYSLKVDGAVIESRKMVMVK